MGWSAPCLNKIVAPHLCTYPHYYFWLFDDDSIKHISIIYIHSGINRQLSLYYNSWSNFYVGCVSSVLSTQEPST